LGRRSAVRVGVLDLQGAVSEHLEALRKAGASAVAVRKVADIAGLDGLIIPGGESTTIGRLMEEYGFLEAVPGEVGRGLAVWGTCAGLIVLARDIIDGVAGQPRLGLMDISAVRNGFGRQVDSFEADLEVKGLGPRPFRGVFIRAPYVAEAGPGVDVLAEFDGRVVAARQGRLLATAFHPELGDDRRLHRYFAEMAGG
jgi:5'-phosphate synthase pdxT subunit